MREGILSDEHIRKMNKAFFHQRPAKKTKYRVKNAVIPFYDLQFVAQTAHTNSFAAIDLMIDQYTAAGTALPPALPSPTETEYIYSPNTYVPFNATPATPMNALPEVANEYGSNFPSLESPEFSTTSFGDVSSPEGTPLFTPAQQRALRQLQIDMVGQGSNFTQNLEMLLGEE